QRGEDRSGQPRIRPRRVVDGLHSASIGPARQATMAKHATSAAPSQRQLRVGELIRHALADALTRGEIMDEALAGRVITVPEVRMSPDLRIATVYVMPLGGK